MICKIIALDPNAEIHEEAFRRKYHQELSNEHKLKTSQIQKNPNTSF